MRVLDASAIVYAWDNYPIDCFPPTWEWIRTEILSGELAIPRAALDEVGHVSPDCHSWLKAVPITVYEPTTKVYQAALAIQHQLGIDGDAYHADGVDENDVLIIATAKVHSCKLVSNEAIQSNLPNNMKRYKIPAVCKLSTVSCENFLQYIKGCNVVFQ